MDHTRIFIGVPHAPADAPLHMKNVHLKDMRNGPEPQRGDAGQPRAQALGMSAIAGGALKGRNSAYWQWALRRPFRAPCDGDLEPRACALGFPVSPLRGLFRREIWRPHGDTPAKTGIFTRDTKARRVSLLLLRPGNFF